MGNCCAADNDEKITTDLDGKQMKRKSNSKKNKPNRKSKKGAADLDKLAESFTEEVKDTKDEGYWEDPDDLLTDTEMDEDTHKSDKITFKRKGHTQPLFKKNVIEKVVKYLSAPAKKAYDDTGAFQFR